MLDLSTCLKYYKREEIQEELLANADGRELGTRYLAGHFGKRPDILQNKADVLELAKQGASSFHISEEHWRNPLALSPSLKKSDLNKMRVGWDLVIDIDCPDWELSKRIAFVVVKILKKHGIKSISCKFSGNKGFHIAVPFKAFPKSVHGKPTSLLFPDKVKRVMEYIVHYAKKHHSGEIINGMDVKKLSSALHISEVDLVQELCTKCSTIFRQSSKKYFFICDKCGAKTELGEPESYISCPKCKATVKRSNLDDNNKKCKKCNSKSFNKEINLHLVLGLDQILISPRHLYRMPYSLHEKSGLVSLPINPFSVLAFKKEDANPDKVNADFRFLDHKDVAEGEGSDFILKAMDFKPEVPQEYFEGKMSDGEKFRTSYDVDDIQEKIPLELFPPSILNMLKGLKDGRKRALFVLVNFLTCVGWDYPDIDELLHEWNEKNDESLRERFIKSQISYHKSQKKKILPPNYSNKMYYADLGVLTPEEEGGRLKNPVNYAKKRAFFLSKSKKGRKKKEKVETKAAADNNDKNSTGNPSKIEKKSETKADK